MIASKRSYVPYIQALEVCVRHWIISSLTWEALDKNGTDITSSDVTEITRPNSHSHGPQYSLRPPELSSGTRNYPE